MAMTDAEMALWVATASKLPPGPWHVGWIFNEGVFPSWYTTPPPTEPADVDGWPPLVDEAALAAAGITEVSQEAAMALAETATTALPALIDEVRRLRAALQAVLDVSCPSESGALVAAEALRLAGEVRDAE